MNVYFVATNYIKEDCWKYLIDVLKVETVFSFIDVNDMSESFRNQLGNKLVRYKRYLPKDGDVESFIKKCVNNIIGGAVRIHQVDGKVTAEDQDGFIDSHYNNPISNLRDTNDKNVMIVCSMYYHYFTDSFSIPIFHKIVETHEYTKSSGYVSTYITDASTRTARYTHRLLKKYLGTDKYLERICLIRFEKNNEQLYFKTKWANGITTTQDGRTIERSFYKFVLAELSKKYPNHFPIKEKNGKRYFTSFYDLDLIEREWSEQYSQDDDDDYDPYGGYGSYENWALKEAYDGDPSNLWNTD